MILGCPFFLAILFLVFLFVWCFLLGVPYCLVFFTWLSFLFGYNFYLRFFI